ncbi:MAG: acetylornithine aminotransferase [Omnitrophica WOR_2 bacterium GWF2_38_59]|nr:MAG: acetylornithine aminotransferase [Omnitrophica WOR_2 bacterium GWA2_37_7]OGX26490.1 MAG: acetylornithine aminotransferase [Omnitrophica WOR_2 bacterium GWF2_38_59]OGX49304.1 MAG: acetylornithine aminotransferase [Omnitrophica WOR_2 bacterium RIFOXYA2_FULL_38_17]OGX51471.1 MAG: acetylornithine aminotransferase [Omnitrophica WOR_2 bacterium RIFOXYA12_FULL_38_10]OGX55887.1 MAG: acetylornithine aminotransferase [Omnitrophica WOR_2 bacterium RIFOXYC2_FULL_38_12]OGX58228.1 MAG: acetylornithi
MKKQDIIKNSEEYILSTYTKTPAIFVKGKGMTLTDIDGKKYLDFFPGWGVNNVGHCHPKVVSAVRDQISKLIHIPNNFYIINQVKLAKEIVRCSFPAKVFFCNSGAEGCEAAIKFARIYGKGQRNEIITMKKSFHGRTLGALAATGQLKYQQGFEPLPKGFKTIDFNDISALKEAINENTIAIMLELVQGEGGVNVASKQYIEELRKICNEKDILLIFDEVQTGMGRTGEMFAFKNYNVQPDLMVLAKALGGGLPIGALVAKKQIADTFKPGMHASTFGGSPLVTKAALGTFKAIHSDKMLKNAKVMSLYILDLLGKLKDKFDCIVDVRGLGLMIGIELKIEGKEVFEECFKNGLIINCTQGNILRFMPALNVTKKQANKALYILEKALEKVTKIK